MTAREPAPSEDGATNRPEQLVSTAWLAAHLDAVDVRIVEVDVDAAAYMPAHIRGAIFWAWQHDLQDSRRPELLGRVELERLLERCGIGATTTVILYGGNHNWFATFSYWLLKHYGYANVRLLDGGRARWLAEGRPLHTEPPNAAPSTDPAGAPDRSS